MSKQLIISVGREYGCGGKEIATKLAEHYNLPLYDSNLLKEIAKSKGVDAKMLEKYDEVPRSMFGSRTVNGFSNSIEVNIANMQFDILKKKAEEGESFVVVGRCAESVLKDYDCMVSMFILGDLDFKIKRTMDGLGVSKEEAEDLIKTHDKKRKSYHNFYCYGKWGDSRTYDITINSARMGVEKTTETLINFIDAR